MKNYDSYYVITDTKRFNFATHDEAYKFYCDNLPNNNYIELCGVFGIVGRTLLYNSKE